MKICYYYIFIYKIFGEKIIIFFCVFVFLKLNKLSLSIIMILNLDVFFF